jgi:GNAT superfamily N-acetyltransferase
MLIRRYEGDREVLRPLFRLADDSEPQIDAYLAAGDIVVADDGGQIVGHLQLVATEAWTFEVKSMAVIENRQGTGIGRALVEAAIQHCQHHAGTRLLVATAAADIGNLRFYQRQGFRMLSIERDAFSAKTGYPEGVIIDGIPLRDRVWLDQNLPARIKPDTMKAPIPSGDSDSNTPESEPTRP